MQNVYTHTCKGPHRFRVFHACRESLSPPHYPIDLRVFWPWLICTELCLLIHVHSALQRLCPLLRSRNEEGALCRQLPQWVHQLPWNCYPLQWSECPALRATQPSVSSWIWVSFQHWSSQGCGARVHHIAWQHRGPSYQSSPKGEHPIILHLPNSNISKHEPLLKPFYLSNIVKPSVFFSKARVNIIEIFGTFDAQ